MDKREPERSIARWPITFGGDGYAHTKHFRDKMLSALAEVRTLGDKLETVVADDLWPLPTYREMLFIK